MALCWGAPGIRVAYRARSHLPAVADVARSRHDEALLVRAHRSGNIRRFATGVRRGVLGEAGSGRCRRRRLDRWEQRRTGLLRPPRRPLLLPLDGLGLPSPYIAYTDAGRRSHGSPPRDLRLHPTIAHAIALLCPSQAALSVPSWPGSPSLGQAPGTLRHCSACWATLATSPPLTITPTVSRSLCANLRVTHASPPPPGDGVASAPPCTQPCTSG